MNLAHPYIPYYPTRVGDRGWAPWRVAAPYQFNSVPWRRSITYRVCDCPEVYGCYAEGYAQGKDKAYFEMSNFDWTQHAKDCGCEPCSAFGKVLARILDHLATGED